MLTLILIFSALAAGVAILMAVRLFQMESPAGAAEQLARTVSPALYAVSTKLDTLQQSLTALLQTSLQNLTQSVVELREASTAQVDAKLHGFTLELRATFDSLAEWLEARLRAQPPADADTVAQITAALNDRLSLVQNHFRAHLEALQHELARQRTEQRELLDALERSVGELRALCERLRATSELH